MLARIVRFTAADPGRTRALLLLTAGSLALASFAAGFEASRYWIDRELTNSTQMLSRSARVYETQQLLWSREWMDAYAQLAHRIAVIPQWKEVMQHDRR